MQKKQEPSLGSCFAMTKIIHLRAKCKLGLTQIHISVKKEGVGRGLSGARWGEMVVDEYFFRGLFGRNL